MKNIVFPLAVLFSVAFHAVSLGTPWWLNPYVYLDPYPHDQPRPPIIVPEGCNQLLSRSCKVISSDSDPLIGELSYITDGTKESDPINHVELGVGRQWIQIDLGDEKEIYAICLWHYNSGDQRAYRDVICQISNDPEFVGDVVTVFNNDHDNSAGLGVGKDKEYIESKFGRPFAVDAIKGRYVRCYSNGYTKGSGDGVNRVWLQNHYTEVEVYGK